LIEFIEKIDLIIAEWIKTSIKNHRLDQFLKRINRGEIFIFFLLGYFLFAFNEFPYQKILFISFCLYIFDRFVLFIKKRIARRRPGILILGKADDHPDYNHSFPSAHASNSFSAILMFYILLDVPEYFFLFSISAGIGRMLSLHHFFSDIIGGWLIGFLLGSLGIIASHYLNL
jgi:membrane-associated phospholipid phosphatase